MIAAVEVRIDLPDVSIIKVERNEHGHILITVETTESSTPCHKCGKQLTRRHGCDKKRTLVMCTK